MSLTKVSYSMINGAGLNILDFGADPTGVADSTSAIQNAIQISRAYCYPND
jgi:polygalacturonase